MLDPTKHLEQVVHSRGNSSKIKWKGQVAPNRTFGANSGVGMVGGGSSATG